MKETILLVAITFFCKLLDNTFGTIKTIGLAKEKFILASTCNALSTFFYLIAVVQLAKSDSNYGIIAACVATYLGTYIPAKFMKKLEPEKLFVFEITSSTLNEGEKFVKAMTNNNFAIKYDIVFNSNAEQVLSCKVYSQTKEESTIIKNIIPESFKYTYHSSMTD